MWREDLQCEVTSLWVDFRAHFGRLMMGDGACCDMTGCIALFLAIDPDIELIVTRSGDEADTAYHRSGDVWRAVAAHE